MTHCDDRISDALDQALEMTFPASDPIAVYLPEDRQLSHKRGRRGRLRNVEAEHLVER